MTGQPSSLSRRTLMISGAAAALGGLTRSTPRPIAGGAPSREKAAAALRPARSVKVTPTSPDASLLRRALAALDQHAKAIPLRDRIAIVDFSAPSSEARLHFLDIASGDLSRLPVAHGMGSDPRHTGFLQRFSSAFGSNASSEGALLTANYYVGKHGRSQRLLGLDPTNDNALDRAIVIHGAWYANAELIRTHGKLGRSQGCFAVGENHLDDVFGCLGQGRLLYAGRA
jgi:hypothetical protein